MGKQQIERARKERGDLAEVASLVPFAIFPRPLLPYFVVPTVPEPGKG